MPAGDQLPHLRTRVPGPRSRALARQLARVESRNLTPSDAIFWTRAAGANVWDADGNRYLDLTAAFGVAALGHTHPRVTDAIRRQAGQLLHGMGDVHPNRLKLELARQLVALTFGRWRRQPARVIFANTGAEAVEAALKTAVLHTGRPRVLAFRGAYHGLTYGALAATWREHFRGPFAEQLADFVRHIPFGTQPSRQHLDDVGAILVEPLQGRAGILEPPPGFLPGLREICDRHGLLLIADEIYTGLGRTGRWFACEHWGVVPDLICVGKALGGGLPIAACIGRADVMDSWPACTGEAIHTSTFLGNPLACAAGLAALDEMRRLDLPARARRLERIARQLPGLRGRGLMLGWPVREPAAVCHDLLRHGIITLPEGDVLTLTPPLTITETQWRFACRVLAGRAGCRP